MTLIGLCGMSGSGKTLVGSLFAMEGFAHIDCDKLVHEQLYKRPDVREAIILNFGPEMLTEDGINRKAMADIVFGNQDKLDLLNELIHDAITEIVLRAAEESGAEYVLLDAPTLFESGIDQRCAAIVGLIAPHNTCIERIINRDGISKEAAAQRLSRQKSEEFLRKHCHYILVNDGNIVGLTKKALQLASKIKKGEYRQ